MNISLTKKKSEMVWKIFQKIIFEDILKHDKKKMSIGEQSKYYGQ